MFCPNCRYEYKDGIFECSDCKIPLVEELPAEPDYEYADLETVYISSDGSRLLVAKSLLEDAGIEYLADGEGLQDLFGAGRIGTGYNVFVGPVKLKVRKNDFERAKNILQDLIMDETF